MSQLGEPPGAGADPVGDFGNDIVAGRGPGRTADPSDTGVRGRSGVDEATVRTLETHLAQLEQRNERMRLQKQTEIDDLRSRLQAGERHLGELGERLEAVRAELAPARALAAFERTGPGEPAPDEHQTGGPAAEALRARLAVLEARAAQLEWAVQAQRENRRHLESRLAQAHARYAAIELTIVELGRTTADLRVGYAQLEAAHRAELERLRARVRELEEELRRTGAQRERGGDPPATDKPGVPDAARRREMSEALAAAVVRLRARAAQTSGGTQIGDEEFVAEEEFVGAEGSVGEQEPLGEELSPGSEGRGSREPAVPAPAPDPAASDDGAPSPTTPDAAAVTDASATVVVQASAAEAESQPPALARQARLAEQPAKRASWLAPAIREVAERRDLKLAGELIVELLAAQKLILNKPLSYAIEIHDFGSFRARINGERTAIERIDSPEGIKKGSVDFLLRGAAPAFSELAAGGVGRRLRGVKVQGKRRRLRRLLAARRPPLALADLAEAGIVVWPGLMLLALAEAIDPAWTKGQQFVIAFVVRDKQSATIFVSVRDGEPVAVTRVPDRDPAVTVRCCELGFMSLLAGVEPPAGQQIAIEGTRAMLDLLISWIDRVQGLLPVEAVS